MDLRREGGQACSGEYEEGAPLGGRRWDRRVRKASRGFGNGQHWYRLIHSIIMITAWVGLNGVFTGQIHVHIQGFYPCALNLNSIYSNRRAPACIKWIWHLSPSLS